jgi:hypothetical protein
MSKQSGKEFGKELEHFVNGASSEKLEDFTNEFLRFHPTLMQIAFGVMMKCVQGMADKKYVDGRNEASQKQARLMIKGYKEELIKALIEEAPDYWTEEKAREHVNADYFRVDSLPLV